MTASRRIIPKILHQVWVGPKPVPKLIAECKALHEAHGWEHRLWTSTEGWTLSPVMDRTREWNGKGDMVRWSALLEYGGVALDADSVCERPLDDRFLEEGWAAYENERAAPGLVACGAMGFPQGHPLVAAAVNAILRGRRWEVDPAWRSVGPGLLTELARVHPIRIYPSGLFYPRHHTGTAAPPCDEPPFTRQLWGSTAGSPHEGYRGLSG